ncbi:hypothetical protein [Haladaptatus halobius]|uniref:hypothetical protein n=1 Tax=Haladaptatus halobius TaxID=2884875 RepID=UPI001D0A6052|nr:hypothetical protein [Haladaptatus halobius]
MFRPPLDPGDRPLIDQPTWRSIIVSYALMAAIPLLLWIVSQPLAGTVTLAGIAGLLVGGRRVYRLIRCFYDCQRFTFNLGGKAQITVAQIHADESN